MGGEGLGDSRKEEDLGGWDFLMVRGEEVRLCISFYVSI